MKIKELKKWKKYYSEKKLTKLSWPMSAKSDQKISYLKSKKKKKKKFLIKKAKKKKKKNYHGPWVPNLILSYQALYITK